MGVALAHLKWSPAVFWASTPHELYAALEALAPSNNKQGEEEFARFKQSLEEAGVA